MSNSFFRFKQFTVNQQQSAMKVTTDACLFGAWCAAEIKSNGTERLLDIGAGTGLLSLMIAQKKRLHVDAVEIEKSAAVEALQNIAASPWKDRIHLHHQDITGFRPQSPYNFIISNPPFYENDLKSPGAERNLAHHSSSLNLQQLLSVIRNCLDENGHFFLLLPHRRKDELQKFKDAGLYIEKMVQVRHSPVHAPSRLMLTGGKVPAHTETSEIIIRNSEGTYTTSFIDLLRDYYLYL